MQTTSFDSTREMLVERHETICMQTSSQELSPAMEALYLQQLEALKDTTYKIDRGIRDIAQEVDMNVGEFEQLLEGKSVLDIGCGVGKFAVEAARKAKRSQITALDINPDNLDRVQKRRNVRTVLGSGLNLQESIGDEEFDIVISSFSTLLWAETAKDKHDSIQSAFDATKVGGKTFFIPVISNVAYRDAVVEQIANGSVDKNQRLSEYDRMSIIASTMATVIMDRVTMDELLDLETKDQAQLSFRAARSNSVGDLTQERYSCILTRLA